MCQEYPRFDWHELDGKYRHKKVRRRKRTQPAPKNNQTILTILVLGICAVVTLLLLLFATRPHKRYD